MVHARRSRRLVLVHGVQLRLVPGPSCPGPEEIVGCQVDEVEVGRCSAKVDALENRLVRRERCGEDILVIREICPGRIQESYEIGPLLLITWIFPDD